MHNEQHHHHLASLSSILSSKTDDLQNDPSVVWSTAFIPGLQNPAIARHKRKVGRRKLCLRSLAVGFTLAMHCRIPAMALSGGTIFSILFLILAVGALANPLRHFEVYTGQWSLSGPGKAFRIVPVLDGIGVAMCLNAIFRAICCCCIASITALYILYGISDERLPYTYCRDFNLIKYEPDKIHQKVISSSERRRYNQIHRLGEGYGNYEHDQLENLSHKFYNNNSRIFKAIQSDYCNGSFEDISGLYNIPAYNFFYLEVLGMRPNAPSINMKLLVIMIVIWLFIWGLMIIERLRHGKLIWNNTSMHVLIGPCIWLLLLLFLSCYHTFNGTVSIIDKPSHETNKDILLVITDSMIIAMYLHSAGTGTELIHGKALNRFASGHIDPFFNSENLIYSLFILLFTALHSVGATVCSILDYSLIYEIEDYTHNVLWVIPLYSRCALVGIHSHFTTVLLFSGMTFSYVTIAYILIKSALHAIFEYRIKLVFVEQFVVAGVLIICILLSTTFTTKYGAYLLESTDAILTGLATPFICLLELVALLYLYRSSDFVNDMIVATEENTCATRIGTQWKIIPFIMACCLLLKVASFSSLDVDLMHFVLGLLPLLAIITSVPLRGCYNAYRFIQDTHTRRTHIRSF